MRRLRFGAIPLAVVAVVLIPNLASSSGLVVWETAVVFALFATSINLLFGSVGIASFGQAAFFGAGAYAVGLEAPHSLNVLLVILLAIAVSAALALGTGLFAWRTTGLAFSMLTLAIAQGVYTLVVKVSTFGGYNGLYGIVATKLGPLDLTNPTTLWYFDVVCVGVGLLVLWQVTRSPFGLTLNAIREDPVRASFLGVNVRLYRLGAFVIAGALAGLAGALFAYSNQVVTPDQLYWSQSATPIIMVLVGGIAYFWGPAVGAVLLTWFLHYLSDHTTNYVLYLGLILMAVLVFLPRGLLSLPAALQRRRAKPEAPAPGSEPALADLATMSQGGAQ